MKSQKTKNIYYYRKKNGQDLGCKPQQFIKIGHMQGLVFNSPKKKKKDLFSNFVVFTLNHALMIVTTAKQNIKSSPRGWVSDNF